MVVSCSSFNFNKAAEDPEVQTPDQVKLTALESELSDIKTDQAGLEEKMTTREEEILSLKATILKLEKKIQGIEKEKTPIKPVQYNLQYTEPAVLYHKARNLLVEEDYTTAAALFTQFINRHPKDGLADNSVYWLGECHYSLGEFKKAISIFQDLEKKYTKSEKVPDAILKTGYSYLSLDDSNRAHHYLKKVIKKYPFSPAADKAQEKLRSFE